MQQFSSSMLLLNTTTTTFHIVDLRMKKMTKQQVAVAEEKCTRIKAVLATLTMQRCANKLAKRGKDERERERGGRNTQKSEEKCNFSIQYKYIFLLPFFILTPLKEDMRQQFRIKNIIKGQVLRKINETTNYLYIDKQYFCIFRTRFFFISIQNHRRI